MRPAAYWYNQVMSFALPNSVDALFVTSPSNIRYLVGFVGSEPTNRDAYILLTKSATYLFTNSLYLEQAERLSRSPLGLVGDRRDRLTLIRIDRNNTVFDVLTGVICDANISRLGFEEDNLTVREYTSLKDKLDAGSLYPCAGIVETMRMYKSKKELKAMKAASAITDACFSEVVAHIKPGVREAELAWRIETYFKENGAGSAFSPIVAFGGNASEPHYVRVGSGPNLKKSDLVLLDFGARVDGYASDMSRVIFTGKPDKKWTTAYEACLAAQTKALSYLGSTSQPMGAVADQLARDEIAYAGFVPYSHSLGHGLGLDIHEAPRLTVKKDAKLLPGMAFTVEPGIYVPGKFGIRIEDTVALTMSGLEVLTNSDKQIRIV